MAGLSVHIAQAVHNERLAEYLLDKPYHDWAVIVSFYAAIHYFEACLFIRQVDDSNRHSETCIPRDNRSNPEHGYHAWRARLIRKFFSQETWKAFRGLRNAGHLARYLAPFPERNVSSITFLEQTAYDHFELGEARKLVKTLQKLKRGLNVEMAKLIYELELHRELSPIDIGFVTPIILLFSTKGDFLHNGRKILQQRVSAKQMAAVERCLESKGYCFTN